MQFLGRQGRKTRRQIESHLVAENGTCACPGTVAAVDAGIEHMLEKIKISAHGFSLADSFHEAVKLLCDPQAQAAKIPGESPGIRFGPPNAQRLPSSPSSFAVR
jgi:hypothetical protein